MGLIDSGSKSNRLLASRRFTSTDLNTSQEAFTEVLDLQSSEIYTQGTSITSSGLPYSGSAHSGNYHTVKGDNISKFWYRFRLTKSNVDSDVWFFISPTGSATGVTPQLIQDGQQTNFISPKYSVVSLANATAEDSPPGYGIKVFKSTSTDSASLDSGDVVSANDYQFDYKTGVLQFNDNKPSSSDIIYMTAYQYVGKTLETGLKVDGDIEVTGNVSGSGTTSTGSFAHIHGSGNLYVAGEGEFGGSLTFGGDAITITSDYSSSLIPANSNEFHLGSEAKKWDTLFLSGSVSASGGPHWLDSDSTINIDAGTQISIGTANSGVPISIGHSTSEVTINDNLTVTGNLDVVGSLTTIESSNVRVADRFLQLASGSTSGDGGIIVTTGANGVGTALGYDDSASRWALTKADDTAEDATSITPRQYVVSVSGSATDPSGNPSDFGSAAGDRIGMIHINTSTGDIFIFS